MTNQELVERLGEMVVRLDERIEGLTILTADLKDVLERTSREYDRRLTRLEAWQNRLIGGMMVAGGVWAVASILILALTRYAPIPH